MWGFSKACALAALMICMMATGLFVIAPGEAATTVYIHADGSIEPLSAPIHTDDNVLYTLTDDMTDPIVIERDGITLDGGGHSLRGTGYGQGVELLDVTDVTVTGMDIALFNRGIYICDSSDSTVSSNAVHDNVFDGVFIISSSGIDVSDNDLVDNGHSGLGMELADDGLIEGNWAAENSRAGISMTSSSWNILSDNEATGNGYEGFAIDGGSGVTLMGNAATDNEIGFLITGSEDLIASDNSASSPSGFGFSVSYSSSPTFESNIITDCHFGFDMELTSNSTMRDNSIANCEYGLGISGDPIWTFEHDIDTSNTVDGKQVYYFIGLEDMVLDDETLPNAGYLAVVDCSRVTVEGFDMSGNHHGILAAYTDNSTFANNTISDNWYGIALFMSPNNTLRGNIVDTNWFRGLDVISSPCSVFSENNVMWNPTGFHLIGSAFSEFRGNTIDMNEKGAYLYSSAQCSFTGNRITSNVYGVFIQSSPYCSIVENRIDKNQDGVRFYSSLFCDMYHNDFMSNIRHASKEPLGNIDVACFDDYPSGGNFYSDNDGVDLMSGPLQDQSGPDGICDSPYIILEEYLVDWYPLMEPSCPYIAPVASFTFSPDAPIANGTVTFNASSSHDDENPGLVLFFRWDWDGDGSWDTDWDVSPVATHVFHQEGVYDVFLEVRNADLMTATCTTHLEIASDEPSDDDSTEGETENGPWLSDGLLILLVVAAATAAAASVAYILLRRPPQGAP